MIWHNRYGIGTPVSKMSDGYVRNVIIFLKHKAVGSKISKVLWTIIFRIEQIKRKLGMRGV